ncbi:HlyD family type I secretion periplasmic adaptor subunit [Phenylobacterium sp.]|jgi:HlyD family type I secretion membrane fusion protein|uniref:HlyD family type I secretion periplasmic adaptor subunit n=1 Tax=Phenylobacterium sp. TaxID=1871053 RepID=UPI002F943BF5
MKLDITPVRSAYVAPTFGGDDKAPVDPALQRRMRRPMIVGALVIGFLVVGLGVWAAFASLPTAISAPGELRVESNRKVLRARELGTIRQILVKEGQYVRAGQPLLIFNDVEARAAVDVLQGQYDQLLAQNARFTAEATGRPTISFPAELTARSGDPRVAGLISQQEFLFNARLQTYQDQLGVLSQRIEQSQNQIAGNQAQVDSVEEQRKYTAEELAGYEKLNAQGYAPKTLILRYQRSMAELAGRRGSLMAEINRLRQQMGETRMNMATLRSNRQSEAAEGMRQAQVQLADVGPRLTAARQSLESKVVRSPVDGYVFNLKQFTVGGVTGAGETLMDVVPAGQNMVVTATVKPQDIEKVKVGMDARVRLVGLNQRWNDPLPAKVAVVSADVLTNDQTGISFYRVDLSIAPKDLKLLKPGTKLTPGMPAEVQIVTGERTVMGYLISPITDTIEDAFNEE